MKIFSNKNKTPKPATLKKRTLLENLGNLGHDPYIDWVLIVIFSLIISVILVAVGVLSYLDVGERLVQKSKLPTAPVKTIDGKMVDYVVDTFDKRAEERAGLDKGYVAPADPSL